MTDSWATKGWSPSCWWLLEQPFHSLSVEAHEGPRSLLPGGHVDTVEGPGALDSGSHDHPEDSKGSSTVPPLLGATREDSAEASAVTVTPRRHGLPSEGTARQKGWHFRGSAATRGEPRAPPAGPRQLPLASWEGPSVVADPRTAEACSSAKGTLATHRASSPSAVLRPRPPGRLRPGGSVPGPSCA